MWPSYLQDAAEEVGSRQSVAADPGELLQLTAIESFAAWRGVSPTAMAEILIGMQPFERDELRQEYAADHQQPG